LDSRAVGLTGFREEKTLFTDGKTFPASESGLHSLKDLFGVEREFPSEIAFRQH
jgi:hypothetical protein